MSTRRIKAYFLYKMLNNMFKNYDKDNVIFMIRDEYSDKWDIPSA